MDELVASFMEAWIEIVSFRIDCCDKRVASFMEAWIEIVLQVSDLSGFQSPPSWRRGLKSGVTSPFPSPIKSPPSWRRGLKS